MFRRRPMYMSTVLPRTGDEKTKDKQRSSGGRSNEFQIPANENEVRSVEWLIDDNLFHVTRMIHSIYYYWMLPLQRMNVLPLIM
jgi:hypothetical protein